MASTRPAGCTTARPLVVVRNGGAKLVGRQSKRVGEASHGLARRRPLAGLELRDVGVGQPGGLDDVVAAQPELTASRLQQATEVTWVCGLVVTHAYAPCIIGAVCIMLLEA